MFTPSQYQRNIFDFVITKRGSGRVTAVAGSGKTTTLIEALALMTGSIAFCAYNKKIATEIQQRMAAKGIGNNAKAGTFHSFGLLAWRRAAPKVEINEHKLEILCERLWPTPIGGTSDSVKEQLETFARKAASMAKQQALGVLTAFDNAEAWEGMVQHYELDDVFTQDHSDALCVDDMVQQGLQMAQQLLKASVQADSEMVDFDDMIYAPLVHNCRIFQNDWVLVDEAQDTNPARRALARKMLRPGGRLLAVGDERQAIYGFTGADADAMALISKEFGCVDLPLTISYRCPKAVVRHAQQWVSHIEAAPNAPEGSVTDMALPDFLKLDASGLTKDDAILCRLTKPLVELAYSLIRRGIGCHVEGKDIGRGLSALAGKWKVKNLDRLSERLEDYRTKEIERLMAKKQEQRAESLADKVETLLVIISTLPGGSTTTDLLAAIDKLFGDTPEGMPSQNLTLSTVHKSKGREWDRVYLYGRNAYMPSKFARQDWQLVQEDNLCYVAVTRAKKELVEVML